MGGDEFIAFCENVEEETIISEKTKYLNEKLVESAKKYMGEDMKIPLGVSIGAVFVPSEGMDFETLFKKADKALYKVKQNGKHGYSVYSEEHKVNVTQKNEISDIRQVFGERGEAHGAYFVEMEYFKSIYRLSVRLASNYKKDIQFLRMIVQNAKDDDLTEIKNLLVKILRKSDCITQNENSIYILLMETPANETEVVKSRILDKIKQSDKISNCEIEFSVESL